jgi:4-carboxymuconolactone decarboxylase
MSDSSIPSRIADIADDRLSPLQVDVVNRLISGRGRVPTPFRIWLHSPFLADRLQALGEYLANCSTLTAREAKIVILFTAVHWHANYVFKAHAREARTLGLPDEVIDAIGAGHKPPLTDPREQVIYNLVTQFNGFDPATDAVFEPAIREFGHAGVADLLALCGYFTAVSLATKLYCVT